jgi:integrase
VITYRTAQGRAQRAGLRLSKRGPTYTLYDRDNRVIAAGDLPSVLSHMPDRRKYQAIGKPSPAWQQLIDAYITVMTAADRPATIYLRSFHLAKMAREIGGNPAELTADQLVTWFSGQQWGTETRRSYRATIRGFLRWAYRTKRIPVDLVDELPHVRVHRGPPRPTPDQVWHQARTDADPRVKLMLRLAAEAGLRRGEISRIHSRDLLPGTAGHQLLVHGKGGKQRVVPINDSLAAAIRAQAAPVIHDMSTFANDTDNVCYSELEGIRALLNRNPWPTTAAT